MQALPDAILSTQGREPHRLQSKSSFWALEIYIAPAPDRDTPNEDSLLVYFINPQHCVLAVADGVGGMRHGDIASKIATERLKSGLATLSGNVSYDESRSVILASLEHAHEEIRRKQVQAASTIAIAELRETTFRTYHIGDSSVLACGNRGRLVYRTIDHSPTGYGVESGLLDSQESLHHAQRHIISNALGLDELRFEVSQPHTLAKRDTVVVSTDGLFDNLYDVEIIEIVRKGKAKFAMDRLVEVSLQRMQSESTAHPSKPDDCAIIVARRT